jgi:hypothetical protein
MEPVAIFDQAGGREFLGMPVRPIAEHASVEFDLMIVATLDRSGQQAADLQNVGVPREKQFPLRKEPEPAPKRARSAPVRSRTTNGKH